MIKEKSILKVSDNSGGKFVKCIKIFPCSKKYAKMGDIIKIVVINSVFNSKIKKSQVLKALIIRDKYGIVRHDGSHIKFNENSVILLNNNEQVIGSRVFGPIIKEIKNEKFLKLFSLSNEIV